MSNLTENKSLTIKIEMDYIGYLDTKMMFSYSDAVNHLHEMLQHGGDWNWMLAEYPKAVYSIYITKGIGVDKWGEEIRHKLYSLRTSKILKFQKLGLTL